MRQRILGVYDSGGRRGMPNALFSPHGSVGGQNNIFSGTKIPTGNVPKPSLPTWSHLMAERRYPLGPRDLARVFTPFHNVSYYSPEIKAFVDGGMRGSWMAYFAYRAAPMGAVPAEVVIA